MMAHQTLSNTMTLRQLLQGFVAAEYLTDLSVQGISGNSQMVVAGDVFVAQAGIKHHAIDFAADAVRQGAVAVLYDANDSYSKQRIQMLKKQLNSEWIPVADLNRNTGKIASRFYNDPGHKIKLIAVTGTDGKTSVTHLLVQALTRMGKTAGSIGTLGYGTANRLNMLGYTTPDAICIQSLLAELVDCGCEYVVMEVSSHALHQYRVSGCEFDIALLTNLGSDHLDYHETVEQYAQAKSRLFEFSSLTGRVFNTDDALGAKLFQQYNEITSLAVNTGTHMTENNSVSLKHSQMNEQGLEIVAATSQGDIRIQSALIGSFNIDNLLSCIAVLQLLNFDRQQIESAMQQLKPIPGRMEYYPPLNEYPAVVIDFAHTEQALKACLSAVKDSYQGELYCVFGCGGDRDQSKRPKMAAVAEQLADHVILTDDNPRTESAHKIMNDIVIGLQHPELVRVIHDRAAAIKTAISQANENDLVVIAGKGHEQFQIIGEKKIPFSDRDLVLETRQEQSL
jgi:UDP-N-acetylmuramoyl-L-alanyl-D-glutamate--2,6-diaminopimelate ligase